MPGVFKVKLCNIKDKKKFLKKLKIKKAYYLQRNVKD